MKIKNLIKKLNEYDQEADVEIFLEDEKLSFEIFYDETLTESRVIFKMDKK